MQLASQWTEAQERMLTAVRQGLEVSQAASIAGISHETIRQWQQIADGAVNWPGTEVPVRDEKRAQVVAFLRELAHERQAGFLALVERLQHNAMTPNPKTGWFDTQAIDKLLSKSSFRSEWYENRKVDLGGTVEHKHEYTLVRQMEPEALEAAYSALEDPTPLPPAGEGCTEA